MAFGYLPVDRSQRFLLPPDMADWLPKEHLAWFVLDVVEALDTAALHQQHPTEGPGRPAYDPDMLLGLLVYAYCTGVRSSRRVEALCEVDVAYRVIAANHVPDHSTIARFRQAYKDQAQKLFVQVLALCEQAGLAKLGVVAIDGTKLAANASLGANCTRTQIEAEVAKMFAEAAAKDTEEDRLFGPGRGDGLPPELADPAKRRSRLEAALRQVQAEEAARRKAEQAQAEADSEALSGARPGSAAVRLARAEAALAELEAELANPEGRLARAEARVVAATQAVEAADARAIMAGRTPGERRRVQGGVVLARARSRRATLVALAGRRRRKAQARVEKARQRAAHRAAKAKKPEPKANLSDPESRLMKAPSGWVQGYNAQAAVNELGLVLAASVTQDHNDVAQLVPMMSAVSANTRAAGVPGPVGIFLFDAGYLSEANLLAPGPDRLVATAKSWQLRQKAKQDGRTGAGPLPGAGPIETMEHRLCSETGAKLYAMRQHTVEPVFGNTKYNRGFSRFVQRGLNAVDAEWKLITTTHNLLKLYRAGRSVLLAT